MSIEELVQSLAEDTITVETEVRTKVAIPLFGLLGWPESYRAEEFPIYGYEGRNPLRPKPADILFFDTSEYADHREREGRKWVADHALMVVELKKPAESIEGAQGQAQFYAQWARVPFYVITNGKELAVYRMEGLFGDTLELACPLQELPRRWPHMERMLKPEAVLRYCQENRLKADSLRTTNYTDYLKATFLDLRNELDLSLERTVSDQVEAPMFRFPVKLSGFVGAESFNSAPQARLLEVGSSVVVLAEPGGGKTYLTKMLARDAILAHEGGAETPVPVVLPARLWKRAFGTITEGIHREVKSFVPGLTEAIVEEDLENGRFLLLVDGLDEAPQESVSTLYDELLRVARDTGTRIVATCRKGDYHDELRERFDKCTIDPLTDAQIEEYASGVLSEVPTPRDGRVRVIQEGGAGRHFLYRIGPDLAELVRSPLFLMMTTAVMKTQPGGRLPNNKADLYSDYTTLLLTEWEWRRLPTRPLEVDQGTKERALAEYAQLTWRRPPDGGAFNRALQSVAGMWDPRVLRDELWRSGLLRVQQDGPEFYHPSFQEYFLALSVSQQPENEFMSFVEEHHADEVYVEVFAFLAGLLRDERRQALLLDHLEKHNLYLYRRCLDTRFDPRSWEAA